MQQQCFHRVASRGVVGLGVDDHGSCARYVRRRVHVHVAHALRVAQHRDARVVLDVLHHGAGTPRNDQVDEPVQLQQRAHLLPRRDEAHDTLAHTPLRRLHNRTCDDVVQHRHAAAGLATALQQQPIAAANSQRAALRQHVGA